MTEFTEHEIVSGVAIEEPVLNEIPVKALAEIIAVPLTSVPDFLRNGSLYENFRDREEEYEETSINSEKKWGERGGDSHKLISVPRSCWAESTLITNDSDLRQLLNTLRFWLVDTLPDSVIGYALQLRSRDAFQHVASEFYADMPKLRQFQDLYEFSGRNERILFAVEENVASEIIFYLIRHAFIESSAFGVSTRSAVATAPVPVAFDAIACAAALHGRLDCLQFAYEQVTVQCNTGSQSIDVWEEINGSSGNTTSGSTCAHTSRSIENLNISSMKLPTSPTGGDTVSDSDKHRNILRKPSNYDGLGGFPWDPWTCRWAAEKGHLECLRYAHTHGCPWDTHVCSAAAKNGYLDCLRYAHEQGCPWDIETCLFATEFDHLDCLSYAHKSGCDSRSQEIYFVAARCGSFKCLQYALQHQLADTTINSTTSSTTARRANESNLQGHNDLHICLYAAMKGHLTCLQYAHEYGCPWDENTCAQAAKNGHLSCLQYAHEHGCPWNDNTWSFAMWNGHLECMVYAHDHGCPITGTCEGGFENGHLDCVKYAHEQAGCPYGYK
mmetsp:Transcript_8092/g.13459  ORF Transcript_8092/g.13459 Transcript_8092/m.13459 type:complete len:555 (-) Transcript_8092:205-1869(-)